LEQSKTMNAKEKNQHPNLSWSEEEMPQKVRTKHVHGLHPYFGKYVPQLVEYFLKTYFKPGDFILDPFVGSGTTVVEANTLGINSIGIDISAFNILLCNVKTGKYDFSLLAKEINDINKRLRDFAEPLKVKYKTKTMIDYVNEPITAYGFTLTDYMREWYTDESRRELLYFRELIKEYEYQDVLKIILTRSARSARLAPHYELDWPKKPMKEPYHCRKHDRICYPTSGALKFLERYGENTLQRLKDFAELQTEAEMSFSHGDSRTIDFGKEITGVMTSPPYVGVIDYHLQHQYAYEFLELMDKREKEIGPKARGKSKRAKQEYTKGIEEVLANCVRQMGESDGPIIFVVNDNDNLYEEITQKVGLYIDERVTREVNRRSGRRAGEYFEDILIMRKEI